MRTRNFTYLARGPWATDWLPIVFTFINEPVIRARENTSHASVNDCSANGIPFEKDIGSKSILELEIHPSEIDLPQDQLMLGYSRH